MDRFMSWLQENPPMADKAVKYLIPDMVVNFEDFPRTASGKVQKFKLKELADQKIRQDKQD